MTRMHTLAVLVLAACHLLVGRAQADDCVDYLDHFRLVARYPTMATTSDVIARDGLVYVADGTAGITVLDPSSPPEQAIMGRRDTDGTSRSLALVDDLLYVAESAGGGLKIIDVSSPTSPQQIGELELPFSTWDVAVVGDVAWVTNSNPDALCAIDVSEPTAPAMLGQLELDGLPTEFTVADGVAYVACSWHLALVDVSDPTAPVLLGQFDRDGGIDDVVVRAELGLAFLEADDTLWVLDVSTPNGIVIEASLPLPDDADRLHLQDDLLYLAGGEVMVVDVSDPMQPELRGRLAPRGNSRGMSVMDDRLYVATSFMGVTALAGQASGNPEPFGLLPVPDASGVTARDQLAYLASDDAGLLLVDVSDPAAPSQRGTFALPGWPSRPVLLGDHAHVLAGGLLWVIDVSDPDAPSLVGSTAVGAAVNDLVRVDAHTLLAGGGDQVSVIDLTDPAAPVVTGSATVDGLVYGVAARGDLACATLYHHGLATLDIADPFAPAVLDSVDTDGLALAVAMTERYAYVAQGNETNLAVVDLVAPADLQVVALHEGLDDAYGITVADGVAYLAASWAGCELVDVTDPTSPRHLGLLPSPGRVDGLAVHGGVLLAADRDGGLLLGPVQCPLATPAPAVALPTLALDAWPNPFNPRVRFSFTLRDAGPARLAVYDLQGRLVRRLADGSLDPGRHELTWDGRDGAGRPVAAGVYVGRLEAGANRAVRRVCLLR